MSNFLIHKKTQLFTIGLLALIVLSLCNGCLKEEKPIKNPSINASSIQTDFTTYNTQGYYNLKEMKFVQTNLKTDWDLRFDAGEHFNIWLNSAKFMMIADAGLKNFNDITDTAGYHFEFDYESGRRDSNAIDEWGDFSLANPTSYNHLYIVDLGRDINGIPLGFIKMKIKDFNANAYTIEFMNLASTSGPQTLTITKDNLYNYQYVNLSGSGTLVNIEPKKADWDLWFTQYTTWIYDPDQGFYIPYLVIGVLLNPTNTEASFDTLDRFNEIQLPEALNKTYYHNWDIIGYTWKNAGNVTGGGPVTYTTYPQITYIVKNQNNEYYKIRFIDFYNNTGTRGYPKWEQLPL